MLKKVQARLNRHRRVRAKISGTSSKPRLSVFRSNSNIYAQMIDDITGNTICSSSDLKITTGTKVQKASIVGAQVAEFALSKWIKECVFDRWGFAYMGRVKVLADAAREKWLKF